MIKEIKKNVLKTLISSMFIIEINEKVDDKYTNEMFQRSYIYIYIKLIMVERHLPSY